MTQPAVELSVEFFPPQTPEGLDKLRIVREKLETKYAEEYSHKLRVATPTLDTQVQYLSGGNHQKVVVAKWLLQNSEILFLDEPTRGIDVGATEFIRKKLVDLSRAGAAVLLVSADLNEVMELSDSLIVLYGGKIAAYFEDTSQLNDEVMGEYMLGLKRQSEEEIGRVCHER